MTTRRFFLCVALAVAVIGLFNLLLAHKIDSVSKLVMRGMHATPKIDMLFLGNSLMAAGLNPDDFAAAWPGPGMAPPIFNAGLGSSSPVEHDLLAREAYRSHPAIHQIVYGFYDFQMTERPGYDWADLEGNRAMAYANEPDVAASLYAPGSDFQKWRFQLIGAVPMLREHSQIWKYVEIFRRGLEEIGMPKAKTNRFGRTADFDQLAFLDPAKFARECEDDVRNAVPLNPPMEALLELARINHTSVVVVEMPMISGHRDRLYSTTAWAAYRDYLRAKLEAQGVHFVDANDWIPDDADFNDALHLNKAGAKLFSTKIAQVLAALAEAK